MSLFKKQVSLHGLRSYISRTDMHVAKGAVASGGEASVGRQGGTIVLPGSPGTVAVFDDWTGHVGDTGAVRGWEFVNGDNDTGATGGVNYTSATNGVVRLNWATSAQPGVAHNVGLSTNAMKNWKANQGNLRFAARVKFVSLTAVQAYIGFSDSGGADMPAYDTGTNAAAGFLSNMTEGIGFMYTNAGSVTTWRGVATKGDADQSMTASVSTVPSPTTNTYDVLEIQLSQDSGQNADFFINGAHVGMVANPLDAAVALAPGFWLCGTDTGTIQLDVDWVNVSANRDTGT
jgi:hypothetical protein